MTKKEPHEKIRIVLLHPENFDQQPTQLLNQILQNNLDGITITACWDSLEDILFTRGSYKREKPSLVAMRQVGRRVECEPGKHIT